MSLWEKLVSFVLDGSAKKDAVLTETKITEPPSTTIGDMQTKPLNEWFDPSVFSGAEFHATRQLRTRLKVLLRDGEVHNDFNQPPPVVTENQWEGIWVPKSKTFRERGNDVDEFPIGSVASDIGPVDPNHYLLFLIAVKTALEKHPQDFNKIAEEIWLISNNPQFVDFVTKHGGVSALTGKVMPRVIDLMEEVSQPIKKSLLDAGLNTISKIDSASDEDLLKLEGLGKVGLGKVRAYCLAYKGRRDIERQAIA